MSHCADKPPSEVRGVKGTYPCLSSHPKLTFVAKGSHCLESENAHLFRFREEGTGESLSGMLLDLI